MDRQLFLQCQPWLSKLSEKCLESLRNTFTFQYILNNALCCFQVDRNVVFFRVADSDSDSTTNNVIDPTVMRLEILMSIDTIGNSAPGLYFAFDDNLYLVDHTSMGQISFPKENVAAGEPTSLLILWPGMQLRLWLPGDCNAMQVITTAITKMSKTLQLSHIKHPCLRCWEEDSGNNKKRKVIDCMESAKTVLSEALDNWMALAGSADRILRFKVESKWVSEVLTCGHLTPFAPPGPISSTDALETEFDAVAAHFIDGVLGDSQALQCERLLCATRLQLEGRQRGCSGGFAGALGGAVGEHLRLVSTNRTAEEKSFSSG